jgi:hypothetical protein
MSTSFRCTSDELLTKDLIEVDIRHDFDALYKFLWDWGCAVRVAAVNKSLKSSKNSWK